MESMLGKWGEISEILKISCLDGCCLQKVRWKRQGAKMILNFFRVGVVKQKTVSV